MDPAHENGNDQDRAQRQPDERAQNQFCPTEPSVVVVLDWFKIKEKSQGLGDFFLPLAFGIHAVDRNYAKFLAGIDFAHVHILGTGVVFSKRLLESTIASTDLPSYCPRLTHWPFRFTLS